MKEETITAVVGPTALSRPGATEGGDASPDGQFTHYRSKREDTHTHTHTQSLSVADLLAELIIILFLNNRMDVYLNVNNSFSGEHSVGKVAEK